MSQTIRQACLLLLAACLPAIVAGFWAHPRWSEDEIAEGEISLADALAKQSEVMWVDARPVTDFAKESIPGALPLNEDEWQELLPPLLEAWHPGQTLVVYCSSKGCHASHEVAKRLREFNVGPVYALHGGWEAWKRK
jgi:rhodanese-related sulfurtransferase